ncbi:MAG: tail fiber domain-containing protein [Bacteroidales bacterium]|nr:tail fiber domain-containing protein [Bacteroidales bacterium]
MNKNIITKGIFTTAIIAAIATGATAQQLPNTFNYQAVVNADDGSPVAAKKITVEVSILQGNDCENNPSACPVLWQELHYPTTSDFGLFSIEIGAQSATNTYAGSMANYSAINWLDVSQGYYYLKVRADFGESENLNSLSDLGTSKFSAVPYSLVAQKADFATTATSASTITPDANDKITNKLSQLADVDVSTVSDGEVLAWDGSKWTNKVPAAQGVSTLKDLTDTDFDTPANKDVLMYNSTAAKWESQALDLKQSLGDLTDVTTTTPSKGQALMFNGTNWANQDIDISLSNINDVSINTSIANGHLLSYRDGKWVNTAPAQWATDANGIHYSETNKGVGIGTSAVANKKLFIQGIVRGNSCSTSFDGDGIDMSHGHIGLGGTATGVGSIAVRENSKATGIGSVAIGNYVEVSGDNSMGIGNNINISGTNSLTVGLFNDKSVKGLFDVGGGNDEDSRKTVFSVTKTKVTITGDLSVNGDVTATGTVTPSDRRLKTNITPLEKSLDKVMKLNGVTFNWDKSVKRNANASTALQYGFIAQEIEKVIPELVTEGSDGYKTVNYMGVIPVLTQAIQEQQQEIEQLKDENKKLNETVEALLKRVEALENK